MKKVSVALSILVLVVSLLVFSLLSGLGKGWFFFQGVIWPHMEPALFLLGGPSAVVGLYLWALPRYSTVALHDGEQWLDVATKWQRRVDYAFFVKAYVGQLLVGGFLKGHETENLLDPKGVHLKTVYFGKNRGVYFVVPVKVVDEKILLANQGRVNAPKIGHIEGVSYPSLTGE